jgi:hypothetical protein
LKSFGARSDLQLSKYIENNFEDLNEHIIGGKAMHDRKKYIYL